LNSEQPQITSDLLPLENAGNRLLWLMCDLILIPQIVDVLNLLL